MIFSSIIYRISKFWRRIRPQNIKTILSLFGGVLALCFIIFYSLFFRAPNDFPKSALVTIEKGATLKQIATELQKQEIILSPLWFRNMVILFGGETAAVAGDYYFTDKESVLTVARRVAKGDHGIVSSLITIPEGLSVIEIANLLSGKLKNFDQDLFVTVAKPYEGYLFPDTYKIPVNSMPAEIVNMMRSNFEKKVAGLLGKVEESGRTLDDIVIMASLLEEEARTDETRKTIAGILWKRIDIGMPLQVDAVFPYIIGKNTYEVTLKDLEFDSPYNTYRYVGLPEGPVTNPGLSSIIAAIEPNESPYLFYLSDRQGNMHYARDFEGHKSNRVKYLD
ncbi:MAG: hypothetical protein COV70_00940 [Parcubacteria group bacterium CG11_big_fil_rev_8_21_14_0_20_39_22]|nr:MAG: hypothetical protein COV70_00940 [Parcubacteria group bacterium CG11_big_fil_rev_8_21_14_0_20_39_22]